MVVDARFLFSFLDFSRNIRQITLFGLLFKANNTILTTFSSNNTIFRTIFTNIDRKLCMREMSTTSHFDNVSREKQRTEAHHRNKKEKLQYKKASIKESHPS